MEEGSEKGEEKKVKVSKVSKARRSKKVRLAVILILMIVVVALFFLWGKFRIVLVGIFVALLVALGLEVSGTDFDLGKLWETGSLEESRVERTESGNWLIDDERCGADDFNCDNFEYQDDAQALWEYCGGPDADPHRLDGDNDGMVCEVLPARN